MIYRFTDKFIQYLDVWLGKSNILAEEAAEAMEYELKNYMNYVPLMPSDDVYKRFNLLSHDNCLSWYYNNYNTLKVARNHIVDIQTFWNTGYHPTTEYSSFSSNINIAQNFKKIYSPDTGQSLITKFSRNKLIDSLVFNVCELYDNPLFMHYYSFYKSNYKKSLSNIENYIINKDRRQYELIVKQPIGFSFNDVCLMGYSDNCLNTNSFQTEFSLIKNRIDVKDGWFNYPFKYSEVEIYYNKLWKIDNYHLDIKYYLKD